MRFSLLSVTPRIRKEDGKLVARTSLVGLLITLTLLHRTVTVDPEKRLLTVRRRLFWFFTRTRSVPFGHIESLTYSYEDWNPSTGMGFAGDTTDCFTVRLNLKDGEQVHLFHFFGEGTFTNNSVLPDWMYWPDYAFDAAGTQTEKSKAYVELLESILSVPLR
jgi:hypothetical protein